MSLLQQGQKAPDFSLYDQNNKIHTLSNYQNQWLVLLFYPKDSTSNCTVELCQLRDNYGELIALNSAILGVNTNSIESHQRFINKQQLPFPLLSDTEGDMSKQYGALFKLGFIKITKRYSFIINPQGEIAKIYRKVIPQKHSQQIIGDLKILQS